jgi:hypothetical protein
MSNLVEHAKVECAFMLEDGDELNKMMYDHLIRMVEEFAKENHSGSSAEYAVQMLTKLLRFEPIRPLQGTDDEWVNIGDNRFQNKRCSRVFKDENGKVYDIEGKIFVEEDGCCYANSDSHVYIEFQYVPTTKCVKV